MTGSKRYAEYYAIGYDDYENDEDVNAPEGYEGLHKLYANIENPLDIGYIEDVVRSEA